jgi:hypothetical protein
MWLNTTPVPPHFQWLARQAHVTMRPLLARELYLSAFSNAETRKLPMGEGPGGCYDRCEWQGPGLQSRQGSKKSAMHEVAMESPHEIGSARCCGSHDEVLSF